MLACCILAMMGPGPCEQPKLSDSIDPVGSYLNQFVGNGTGLIQIYEAPGHYFGLALDPTSIDNLTVQLQRASDGSPVGGDPSGFDFVGNPPNFPLGVSFLQGGLLDPCDLDADTVYNLILDGLRYADGSPVDPVTIAFRTLGAPAGYAPNYCSAGPALTWWTLADVNSTTGLNGGIAADAVTTYLFGVEDSDSVSRYYYGYDAVSLSDLHFGQVSGNSYTCLSTTGGGPNVFAYPPYIAVLKIFNSTASDYDLSASAGTIQIVDILNKRMNAKLPGDVIPAGETLLLYVANNGSTYYMYDSTISPGVHTFDLAAGAPECGGWDCCQDVDLGCPTMDPPTAFANAPAATW
jgi:hypothetical protein